MALDLKMEGRRPRGRPHGRWKDLIERDMKEVGLTDSDTKDS